MILGYALVSRAEWVLKGEKLHVVIDIRLTQYGSGEF
jgi:hypothetical protein